MTQRSSFIKNTDSLLAAIAGFFIILLFCRHGGIGISPDGVVYSSVAENIKAHASLTDYNQKPVVNFPVLYPVILSFIGFITRLQALAFAPLLNALLLALVIYLSGQITTRFLCTSKWYKRILLSCIVLSPCLLEVYSMIWSETFFIAWLLLFMMALKCYFNTRTIKALLVMSIMAALISVTRYAGVTALGTGGLLLLLDKFLPWRKKIQHLLLFTLVSPALLVINVARNYQVSGTLMGFREKAIRTFNENLFDTGSVFCDWLPFTHGHYTRALWVAVLILIFFSAIWLWQRVADRQTTSYEHIASSFFLLYVLFMVITASTSRYEQLNSRLLSPVFIPFIWVGSNWLLLASKKINAVKKKWWIIAGAVIFLSFQYNQLTADYETWDGVKDAGIPGYTEDEWKLSETVQYIQKNPMLFKAGISVFSNADDAIYFFTGKQARLLPHKEFTHEIQSFLKNPHCLVIWFKNGENPDLVDRDFISSTKKMKLLKQFSDGAIYTTGE